MGRGKLKDQNFTQFYFAQTHIDGTGQEKIIGTGMVRESKSDFIGTGSRTYPVPIGQTLKSIHNRSEPSFLRTQTIGDE